MKLSLFSVVLASLFLFSCEKEKSYANRSSSTLDTSDVAKFINTTGITDAQLKINLDSLVERAKRHGWWDLCNVIYPFAGATEKSCKFNLKDPRDLDEAFRLTFLGNTWTYSAAGANPGESGYGHTYFNPSIQIANPNSAHLSVYSMSDAAGGTDNADIGAYDNSTWLGFYLSVRDSYPDSSGRPFMSMGRSLFQGTGVNGSGFFLVTKTSSDIASFYRGSSLAGADSAAISSSLPNMDLFICNQNYSDSPEPYPFGFSQRGLSFITIGAGIDGATETLMYSDITNFVENK
jgi:hypothetical protein